MDLLNLVFFANGANFMFLLCAGIYILRKKRPTRMNSIVGWMSVYFSIWTFKDIFICFTPHEPEHIKNMIVYLDGWSAIAYGIYLIEISTPRWINLKRIFIMLVPFLMFTILYLIHPSKLLSEVYIGFLALVGLLIVMVSIRQMVRYVRFIRNTYSNLEDVDISWLKYIYAWFVVMQIIWVVDTIFTSYVMDIIYYTVFSIGWYRVICYSSHLKSIIVDSREAGEEKNGDTSVINRYPFAGKLEERMIEQELFKKPGLSLYDLTIIANTNRTYLSDYFCHVLQTTFCDYVNHLRIVKAAVPLMKSNDKLTFEAVASMSGFNSISTFRRAFIKNMDMTPSQYRNMLLEMNEKIPDAVAHQGFE